jgi:hypothetical protein
MTCLEKTFHEIELLEKAGWKHKCEVNKIEKSAYIPLGENFFKKHSADETFSVTITKILSNENPKSKESRIKFYTSEKKVSPVVGWRVDFWKIDCEGELTHYGGYKTYGSQAYADILDYAAEIMIECEKIIQEEKLSKP